MSKTPFTRPPMPDELQEIIATHRALFGGWTMTATPPEPPADGATPPPSTPPGDPADLGDAGKRAIAAARERANKAEADLRAANTRLQEYETAKLTDQQRLEKERDDARTDATSTRAMLDRYEAAEAAGLPLSWAKRLVGSTRDELDTDAKAMAADLGKGGTPPPDPSQANPPNPKQVATSVSAGRALFEDRHTKK